MIRLNFGPFGAGLALGVAAGVAVGSAAKLALATRASVRRERNGMRVVIGSGGQDISNFKS
jgi:hypothetical protein